MPDVTNFDDFVQALRTAFFALRGVSDELLADLGCTAVERGVLQDLTERGAQTVPELAHTRSVSRQTMQKTVDRLLRRKWLATQDNPRHQRSVLLALTAAGTRLFAEMRARERRLLARTALPVSGADLRGATEALRALATFLPMVDIRGARRANQGER